MIKALVVDNSKTVRRFLSGLLKSAGLSVDEAEDGYSALKKIKKNQYQIITVDLEIPGIDGIELIRQSGYIKGTKIIIISSHITEELFNKIKSINPSVVSYIKKEGKLGLDLKNAEDSVKQKINKCLEYLDSPKYIFVGASTGGPRIIEAIVRSLPEGYPHPVCVVQHMPPEFTKTFARRLNSLSRIKVVEAKENEELTGGKVIIGKGGNHLNFSVKDGKIVCMLKKNRNNSLFIPSINEMFMSALNVIHPRHIVAVLLTGIGNDGVEGIVRLKKSGATTIVESSETATVYGMPKEAVNRGGAVKILPYYKIIDEIVKMGKDTI
ncbi:response regulator [Persephonella atlantica]|uniref:protein-glutamate methylesterase n=1 Tax=Persephonella atlantica TaxID=2699429 RepID=A0ABS1GFZ2_9AQUI|nr:chemotaxis protein CheB [Persephonella atlantica]MBK3331746.1 response regulator [Persephonella atlantica]